MVVGRVRVEYSGFCYSRDESTVDQMCEQIVEAMRREYEMKEMGILIDE
jgi:hypothetical protein